MNPLPILRTMRPRQWSKNVFVLAALGFALGDRRADYQPGADEWLRTLLAFAAFCLGSSAVYLMNDVVDVERDRAHPRKRHRPIPSGALSVPAAVTASAVSALLALTLGWFAAGSTLAITGVVGLYMAINVAYCLRLKHVVLVDVFCIATGFLLRVVAGGVAARTPVSHWLLLCTLFLALFLGLNKRRAEIALLGAGKTDHRATLDEYTAGFLDQMTAVLAACTIVCYTMYTVDAETAAKFGDDHRLIWSVPFVVFGVGRYMYLVDAQEGGGSPTRIFLGGDPFFLANTLAWLAVVAGVVLLGW